MSNQNIIPFRHSMRTRLLALILGLTLLSIVIIAFFSVSSILRAGQSAQAVGDEVLRQQAEEFLVQMTKSNAQIRGASIEDIRLNANHIARFAGSIFDVQNEYESQTLWLANEKMFAGPDGQFINGEADVTTVYVPNTVTIDDELLKEIELSSYLDRLLPGVYESDPNVVAIYMVHKKDFTRFYPNIGLGLIVPPDFSATGDIFFTMGTPENNPGKESVWTPVYNDPEGQGLLITAVSPIYTNQGEFIGTIGVDLSLADLAANIENENLIADGYTFLINQEGVSVALPEQGYEDIYEKALEDTKSTVGIDLSEISTPFASVFASMKKHETGFQAVNANGKDLFVAYSPISNTGLSMASVVEADNMLQATSLLEQEIETSTQSLVQLSIIPISLALIIFGGIVGYIFTARLTSPIQKLASVARQIGAGNWELDTIGNLDLLSSKNEIGVLANAFMRMTGQLQQIFENLEKRVNERTEDLALAAEIGRRISQVWDVDALLAEAVRLIQNRFDLYHAQVYLVDDENKNLVLRVSTGDAGKQLLDNAHSLPLDAYSLNGQAAVKKQTIIISDTTTNPIFKPHELLPHTRSEVAIPLLVGERVIGVIDLQGDDIQTLSEESLPALEALAGQLAIAIENANLLAEMEKTTLFLDSIIANIPSILFVKEAEQLRYVRVSRGMEELVGLSASEIEGKNHYDFFPKETAESFAAQDYDVLAQGGLVSIPEEMVVGQHGTVILHTLKAPVFDAQGNAKYLIGISRDITDRKKTEQQLARRVAELNCLNDLGRRSEEGLHTAEFLAWASERVVPVMSYPDSFLMAVKLGGSFYGKPEAPLQKRHIIEELYVGGELVGQLYFAYTDESLDFSDEDSAFIGAIGGRLSSYIEGRNMLRRLEQQAVEMAEQATDLQQVAKIGTAVATILDPNQLMQTFVDQTKEMFDLYHAHIYLFESDTKNLRLSAGAGEIGRQMVAEKRSIALAKQQSLVAKAARTFKGVIVNDVQNEPGFLPHPLLPETRSEMAVPLVVFEQLIGVLDVQADEISAFTTADISIFTTLATQVAVALQNANQYKQTQKTLQEMGALQRAMTRKGWQAYLTAKDNPISGFMAQEAQIAPIIYSKLENQENTVSLDSVRADKTAVLAPVKLGDTSIGALGVRPHADHPLSDEQQALLQSISEQVGQALERARLFEETELARSQTEALYDGSDKVVRSTSMDEVLQAVVHSTRLKNFSRAAILMFNQPWAENPPEMISTAASHVRADLPDVSKPDDSFPLKAIPFAHYLRRDKPFIVKDILNDNRANEEIANFFENAMKMRALVVYPLIAGDEWIGVMTADNLTPISLTDEEARQISSLSDQAATVIQSIRLYTAAEKRAAELALINRVVSGVSGTLEIEQSLQMVADELAKIIDDGQIAIALMNNKKDSLTVVAETFDADRAGSSMGFVIPIEGNLLTQEVLQTRKTIIVNDAQNDPRLAPVRDGMILRGVQTLYLIPMIAGNTVVGTVGIDIVEEGIKLSDSQLRLAETLIFQAATAVQNAQLFTETQERAEELAIINTISEVASSQLDISDLFTSVGDVLQKTFDAESVYFALFDKQTEMISFPYFFSLQEGNHYVAPRSLATGGLTGQIIQTRQSLLRLWEQDDAAETAMAEGANIVGSGRSTEAYLGVPMVVGNEIIGVMAVNSYKEVRVYDEQDKGLMEILAGTVGVAIQNARQFQDAKRRAERESIINTISQKIQAAPTVESALETTIREMSQVLNLKQAVIQLNQERPVEHLNGEEVELMGEPTHE